MNGPRPVHQKPRRSRRSTGFERRSRDRSQRARSHLARRKGGRGDGTTPRLRPLPWWALAVVFMGSVLVGSLVASPVLQRVGSGGSGEVAGLSAISVQGNQRLTAAEVADATGLARGQALDQIDILAVVASLESHPWIRTAEAVDLPTGDLVVRVEEREPLAVLSDGEADSWRWVDAHGVPFAETDAVEAAAMPKLYSDRRFDTGEANGLLAEAVSLALEVPRRGLPSPANLEVPDISGTAGEKSEGWVLHTGLEGHSLEVVLGWGESLGARLDRLAWLLTSDLEATQSASRVDLRFDDQAVLTLAEAH